MIAFAMTFLLISGSLSEMFNSSGDVGLFSSGSHRKF